MITYNLLNIQLSESRLKRLSDADDWKNVETRVSTGYKEIAETGAISVMVGIGLKFKDGEDKVFVDLSVQMTGKFEPKEKFEPSEENNTQIEVFASIGAPAIVFPFVREHAHSLASKSGINFWLPPVNFVQLAEKKKAEKEGKQ